MAKKPRDFTRSRSLPSWLLGELWRLVPAGLRRAQSNPGTALVVELEAEGLHFLRYRAGWLTRLGEMLGHGDRALSSNAATTPGEIDGLIRAFADHGTTVIVRLSPQSTRTVRIGIPRASDEGTLEGRLAGHLADQLGGSVEDYYWSYGSAPPLMGDEHIEVTIYAALRADVEAAIATVSALLDRGARPSRPIFVVPADTPIESWSDLVLAHRGDGEGPIFRRDWAVLPLRAAVVLTAVMAVAALASPIVHQTLRARALATALAQAQVQSEGTHAIRTRIDEVVAGWQAAVKAKQAMPPILETLNRLTRVVPDDTALVQLYIVDTGLTLGGVSARPDELLEAIGSDPLFADVRHRFDPTLDPQTRRSHVQISATIRPASR